MLFLKTIAVPQLCEGLRKTSWKTKLIILLCLIHIDLRIFNFASHTYCKKYNLFNPSHRKENLMKHFHFFFQELII